MANKDFKSKIITLTTDFGTRDAYVGAMKGVMYFINNIVQVVDITNDIQNHNILSAALVMKAACPYYPEGSIHVGVVDPGVGGKRRPLLLKIQKRFYVGPDNGIFGLLLQEYPLEGAWALENKEYFLSHLSSTFHGRDIFAPVAAHLSKGIDPQAFGPPISDPTGIDLPAWVADAGELTGEVLWVDHFGNCVTNLSQESIEAWAKGASFQIEAASAIIMCISHAYEGVARDHCLAIFGSSGYLEIACNQARANLTLGLAEGDSIVLRKEERT